LALAASFSVLGFALKPLVCLVTHLAMVTMLMFYPSSGLKKTEKMRKNSKKETNNHLESWLVNRIQFDTGI
jgi:hypothetical protein